MLYAHFILRTTEAQRDQIFHLGAHTVKGWHWDLNLALPCPSPSCYLLIGGASWDQVRGGEGIHSLIHSLGLYWASSKHQKLW